MSITLIIIAVTTIVSFIAFSNQKMTDDLIFNPPAVTNHGQWYRFFSSALIHANIGHLFFNMWSFYSFGGVVEANFRYLFGALGPILYLALYVISQFLCLLPTYLKHRNNYYYQSLGASGAISAVVFAGIVLSPLSKVGILFIPIGIPGFILGFLFLSISAYLDKKGSGIINHSAHLYGALAGIVLLIIFGYAFSPYNILANFVNEIRSF